MVIQIEPSWKRMRAERQSNGAMTPEQAADARSLWTRTEVLDLIEWARNDEKGNK
jgi:hypothetical protein